MTTQETAPAEWRFAKRLGFRFVFAYFVLYYVPFPLDLIPFIGKIWSFWAKGWEHLVIWTGAHALHLSAPIVYQPTGSGDTMHDYVLALISLAIALTATVIWSVLDRNRKSYARLASWMRVYLRYALAAIMLSYGFSKVFDLQFSPPSGLLLTESYGQSSPMHLAWTFMGFSVTYTVFAGVMECLGGLLLLFRRTATLGAIVVAVVMVNVVMMNFCFDIPVKLYSAHLLLTALVILGSSMKRLLDVLVIHRAVEPEDIRPPQWTDWRKWARRSVKALYIGSLFVGHIGGSLSQRREYDRPRGPLDGLYEIESLKRNGADVPLLYTGGRAWRWMAVNGTHLRMGLVDGTRLPTSRLAIDSAKHGLTLSGWDGPGQAQVKSLTGELIYSFPSAGQLLLQGSIDGAPVEMHLRKKEDMDFPLMNRGFHWISEFPYNR